MTRDALNIPPELLHHVPLAAYTTWQVGGPARTLFKPTSSEQLSLFLKQLPVDEDVLFIGLGSNLLVRDGGFDGTVILLQGALRLLEQQDATTIVAQAGVSCGQLARFAARLGLRRLEFLAGIPGTVGGALAMNAGCHGSETWNQIMAVEMISRRGDIIRRLPSDFEVSYRHVVSPPEEWFLAGYFKGLPGHKEEAFAEIKDLLEYRTQTQPTDKPNCGSVFRNPPGTFAAKLIEESGLKGFAIGGAMVSPKHANFIVNTGVATAADIEALMKHVQECVFKEKGLWLLEEVKIVGKSSC